MSKKVSTTILLSLSIMATVFAQERFNTGYVITKSNDTLQGSIQQLTPRNLQQKCTFKRSGCTHDTTYTPDQLLEYGIDGGNRYKVRTIAQTGQSKRLFLETLAEGEINLFSYRNDDGESLFLQLQDPSLIELKNSLTRNAYDNQAPLSYKKEYVGVLTYALKDLPNVNKELKNLPFDKGAILKLIEAYHQFKDPNRALLKEKTARSSSMRIAAISGINFSRADFVIRSRDFRFFDQEEFTTTSGLSVGLAFTKSNLVGLSKKFTLTGQIAYSENFFKSQKYLIKIQYLAVPVYLSYNFPIGKITPSVNFGLTNSFAINRNIKTADVGNQQKIASTLGRYQISALFGASLNYVAKNCVYILGAHFDWGSGINAAGSVYNNLLASSSKVTTIYFGLGVPLARR